MSETKPRIYCFGCGRRLDNSHPQAMYCPDCRREMAIASKTPKKKYEGPSIAEIDKEARKMGLSYGHYMEYLRTHKGEI